MADEVLTSALDAVVQDDAYRFLKDIDFFGPATEAQPIPMIVHPTNGSLLEYEPGWDLEPSFRIADCPVPINLDMSEAEPMGFQSIGRRHDVDDAAQDGQPIWSDQASIPSQRNGPQWAQSEDWIRHKAMITHLYCNERKTLKQVMQIMIEKYNLHAT